MSASCLDDGSRESGSSTPPGELGGTVVHVSQPQQPYDEDEHSGEIREYSGVFEGPEKTLEVVFRKIAGAEPVPGEEVGLNSDSEYGRLSESNRRAPIRRTGLRTLARADLDRICARARCTILSHISNRYLDAYVLSESSLFVYPYMIVLKTCGTTTLLRCVATLIEIGKKLGLEIDWLGYNRKNFSFPGDQMFPHGSFHQEMDYLHSHRGLSERLNGNGYTLGPVTSDHWFVFIADHTKRYTECNDTDRVLNIMMFDIDQAVAKKFYFNEYPARIAPDETEAAATARISQEQTRAAGIDALVPRATIDPCAFEPCGYSMNAILSRAYATVHVTPEEGSSYASFETNLKLADYAPLIADVVRAFRPRRFVVTLMADEGGLAEMGDNPLFAGPASGAKIAVPKERRAGAAGGCSPVAEAGAAGGDAAKGVVDGGAATYRRRDLASIKVEDDCNCLMGSWVLDECLLRSSSNCSSVSTLG